MAGFESFYYLQEPYAEGCRRGGTPLGAPNCIILWPNHFSAVSNLLAKIYEAVGAIDANDHPVMMWTVSDAGRMCTDLKTRRAAAVPLEVGFLSSPDTQKMV